MIISRLSARVPDILDTEIATAGPGWIPQAVPLLEAAGPPPLMYVLWLHIADPVVLLSHPEIRILFATYDARVRFTGATLAVIGTSCVYETAPSARLANDDLLPFVRGSNCNPLRTAPTGDLKLTVRLAQRNRIAVWTFVPPTQAETGSQIKGIVVPGHIGPSQILRGRYVDYSAAQGPRRIELLNYVWQVSDRPTWLWEILGVSAALIVLGVLIFPMRSGLPPDAKSTGSAAVGVACIAAALGLLYAVLVPPFQAADEPDHLLSYAQLTGKSFLGPAAAEWARTGHLERIKFQSYERFRPTDVGKPYPTAWADHVFAEDVSARSPLTALWWNALANLVGAASVQQTLLWVRLASVLLFALSVAAGTALLVWTAADDVRYSQLLPLFMFVIPALPFFAMYMSEFSLLTAAYVLLACCVLALFVDGSRSAWVGLPFGLAAALAMASGLSALPMLPLIIVVLCGRIVLGQRAVQNASSQVSGSALFWAGVVLPLVAVALTIETNFLAPRTDYDQLSARDELLHTISAIWQRPWTILLAGAIAYGLELGTLQLRHRLSSTVASRADSCVRWFAAGVATAIGVSFVVSVFVSYPHLQVLEVPTPPSISEYIAQVLAVVLSTFRLDRPDPLLFSSFWAGFGWLDTTPGELFLTLSVVAIGVSGIGLFVWIAAQRDARRFAWLAFIGAGFLISLASYALATYGMHRNLHGRYLIGPYLSMLSVLLVPMALVGTPASWKRWPVSRPGILLALAGAVHTYCLSIILGRYF